MSKVLREQTIPMAQAAVQQRVSDNLRRPFRQSLAFVSVRFRRRFSDILFLFLLFFLTLVLGIVF